jgi:uncharacterized protein (TIGR02271 family)
MNYEKIVTLYDTAQHAEAARRNLEAAGFPSREISSINNQSLTLTGDKLRDPSLWQKLFGRDIQSYEAALYGRAVESGGVILTIRVPETDIARATSILNAHESVDLRKRAVEQGLMPATSTATSNTTSTATSTANRPMTAPATMAATGAMAGDEVLRLAEEHLNVDKRIVQDGTTRIRRFITETPVEAQVTLHEEHVQVIRRVITDAEAARDIDWTDKTIEVAESAEEPVISKSAHIAEEVVIHKEATDRVKTVRDKVRRQQVEVEHVPPDRLAKK